MTVVFISLLPIVNNMNCNLQIFLCVLALFLLFVPCKVYSENKIYAVIELPPFGCQPSNLVRCINTEYTQIVVNAIDDGTGTIQAFPYPRAVRMFESGRSSILIALANKRLMEQAHTIELYFTDFYLVSMETDEPLGRRTISYLRGADAQREIASFVTATPFEVNDYDQIEVMLRANRLDYVIVPRYIYEAKTNGVFRHAKVLSKHRLPILLYVNKKESLHLEKIKDALSKVLLPTSDQYRYLFI